MKSDIEQLRDLCNSAIEQEKLGNMRAMSGADYMTESNYLRCRFNAGVYEPIIRLREYIVLKPKKEL